MSEDSRRLRLLEAFRARLMVITKAGGYDTDAGLMVFLGEAPELGTDDPPQAIAIVVGDDAIPGFQGEHALVDLPIVIAALSKADLDEPWVAVERVLSDIKRAVELPDRRVGKLLSGDMRRGQTRTLNREPGSDTVGASVTYLCRLAEVWGHPEA